MFTGEKLPQASLKIYCNNCKSLGIIWDLVKVEGFYL